MAKKKVVLEKGVEKRTTHYRFRYREPYYEQGVKKFRIHSETFEFRPEAECQANKWPKNHDMWPANALADANAASRRFHQERTRDASNAKARPVVQGSLREWLERYRDEGLLGHAYNKPDQPPPFQFEPRSQKGRDHDVGQINTLLRMGGFKVRGDDVAALDSRRRALMEKNRPTFSTEVQGVLETEVAKLAKTHFKTILDRWSGGKAKASTKRRLRSNLRSCMEFHDTSYRMPTSTDWMAVTIVGDGQKPAARALNQDEWSQINQSLNSRALHPSVLGCITFMRWTGCRRGEACNLRWENITWPKANQMDAVPVAQFDRTKAKRGHYKDRRVPVNEQALEGLRIAAGLPPGDTRWPKTGWVFVRPIPSKGKKAGDEHVAGTTIYQAFARTFGKKGLSSPHLVANIKPAAPHHMRHTRATELSVGMGAQQMMELFGWDDPDMVQHYRHEAENMGLLVRDADNVLRPAAQMENEQAVLDFVAKLPAAKQERLFAQFARLMAGAPAKTPKARAKA